METPVTPPIPGPEPLPPVTPIDQPKSHFVLWLVIITVIVLFLVGVGVIYILGTSSQVKTG